MKQQNNASINDVKFLLILAAENGIDVVFCEPGNKVHDSWRTECIQHKWAKIYQDMDLSQVKRELEEVLRFNGIEPNKEIFDHVKEIWEPLREVSQAGVKNE